ncbi:MAG: MATE family efflux transporter [Eubacteriales bacterium]|nr:MATE family efflux transporter [Eubacteriales bacterium]
MEVNMTTGRPYKTLVPFALNVLVGNLVLQLYNVCDSVIVGNFNDARSVAAIGVVTPINFMFIGFISGLCAGISIKLADRYGADDREGLRAHAGTAVLIALVVSLMLSVGLILFNPALLTLLRTPTSIYADSRAYLNILYGGIIVTVGFNLSIGMMRAVGDSRSPLFFYVGASLLNILLDLIFVGLFDMGVPGAAYATILAQAIGLVMQILYLRRRFSLLHFERRHLRWQPQCVKNILNQALPMGIQFSITAIGTLVVQAALNTYGPEIIAGFSAANKVQALGFQLYLSLAIAIATFVGQNRGARRPDRIRAGVRQTMWMALACSAVVMVVTLVAGRIFVGMFTTDPSDAMMGAGLTYYRVAFSMYPILALLIVYRNALQGLGFSGWAMMAGVVEMIVRVAVIVFLTDAMGYVGVCLSDPLAWIPAGIGLVIVFYRKLRQVERKAGYAHANGED